MFLKDLSNQSNQIINDYIYSLTEAKESLVPDEKCVLNGMKSYSEIKGFIAGVVCVELTPAYIVENEIFNDLDAYIVNLIYKARSSTGQTT